MQVTTVTSWHPLPILRSLSVAVRPFPPSIRVPRIITTRKQILQNQGEPVSRAIYEHQPRYRPEAVHAVSAAFKTAVKQIIESQDAEPESQTMARYSWNRGRYWLLFSLVGSLVARVGAGEVGAGTGGRAMGSRDPLRKGEDLHTR